ncbi:MAG: pentapeptide repeat-containing protein [Thermoplasmatales archaeon]|nr:pentapeptide repeat-containing protein [Thermoplasmatales archaeon]
MTKQKHRNCIYKKHDGSICSEKALSDSENSLCIFHEKIQNKNTNKCMKLFYDRLKAGETDFEGYILIDLDLINKGIKSIGEKNKEINFYKTEFSGRSNFMGIRFLGTADFRGTRFLGDGDFRNVIFLKEALFKDSKFSRNALFKSAKFLMSIVFSDVEFLGNTEFMDAEVNGTTVFKGAKFSGYAGFMNTLFSGFSGFKGVIFSDEANFTKTNFLRRVIFDSAKFLGHALFNNVNFSGDVGFNTVKFSSIASFKTASFSGNAGFTGTIFLESAVFRDAEFFLDTNFNNVRFSQIADFIRSKFSGNTDFIDTSFIGNLNFFRARFSAKTRFNRVSFFKNSDFSRISFSGDVDFFRSRFLGMVDFFRTKFFGCAFFKEVIFSDNGKFTKARFVKIADFSNSSFEKNGSFENAIINYARFYNTEFRHVIFNNVDLTRISFTGSILEDSYISNSNFGNKILLEEMEANYGQKICKNCKVVVLYPPKYIIFLHDYISRFSSTSIINRTLNKIITNIQKLTSKPIIRQNNCHVCGEKLSERNIIENEDYTNRDLMFKKAEEVYRKIKLSLQNEGDYTLAGDFYFREMLMRRKENYYKKNISHWIFNHIYSKICGYGEKPLRVILTAFFFIIIYAFMYHFFQAITPINTQDFMSNNVSFSESLYFSIVTFTTLGYGDYRPMLPYQHFATIEALIGAFMIALFVLVFGRKMLR